MLFRSMSSGANIHGTGLPNLSRRGKGGEERKGRKEGKGNGNTRRIAAKTCPFLCFLLSFYFSLPLSPLLRFTLCYLGPVVAVGLRENS